MVADHEQAAPMTLAPTKGSEQGAAPQSPTGSEQTGGSSPQPVVRSAMRLRKARQRRRRATVVQGVLTGLFVIALLALAFVGWRSSLKLTGGRDLEITDPAAPGYVAEVRPTDADLLAITAADGSLATMLLVLGTSAESTTVVPISAWLTLWEFEDAGPGSARNLFESGGVDAVRLRLGVDLTFGMTGAATVPAATIESLAAAVGPVTINLPDNVIVEDGAGGTVVRYPAGQLTLQPTDVMEFLSVQGVGEAELNRSIRLTQFWTALFDGLAASGATPSTAVDESGAGDVALVAEIVESLTSGQVSMQLLPTNEIPLPDMEPPKSIDRVDDAAMKSWVPSYVPYPTSAFPGQRASVNVLNGTTNPDAIRSVAPKVVAAGGEISLTGNADSFDIATSTVQYSTPEARAAAEAIAAELGLTATAASDATESVDVTVVVGKDLSS